MTTILRMKYQIPWVKVSLCIWFPHYSISSKNLDGHLLALPNILAYPSIRCLICYMTLWTIKIPCKVLSHSSQGLVHQPTHTITYRLCVTQGVSPETVGYGKVSGQC